MPRIHPYGEPRTKDSPIGDFFLWLFVLGLALPMSYGWVLVNWGLISNTTLFTACGGLGVVVGFKEAIGTVRRNAKARKATALQAVSVVEKEGLQDRRPAAVRSGEKLSAASKAALGDCEAYQKPKNAQYSDSNNAFEQEHVVADRRIVCQGLFSLDGYRDGDDGGGARRHHHCRPQLKRQG